MMHNRALAAAQVVSAPGDVALNLERHAVLVRLAALQGVRTLVFPELSLTGYEPDLAPTLAFAERDSRLDALSRLAVSAQMTVVVGAPVRIGMGLHIGAFALLPDGTKELYTKRYLGKGEEAVFRSGDRDPLVRCGAGTAALAVCADANHPSHPEAAAARGARTYLVSTFIEPSELERKTEGLRTYAARHSMTVVFANAGGPSGGMESGGSSAVWSERGDLLAQLDGAGEGLVVAVEDDSGWQARTLVPRDG